MVQDEEQKSVWIAQPAYTENLLKGFGMQDCKLVSTPVDVSSKLVIATDKDECVDRQQYQSAIGSLMYLSVSTRPDISYAVGNLARFSSKPTKEHWIALKCVMHYLNGTVKHGILYSQEGTMSVLDSLTLTGPEISMTESQHLATCFNSVEVLLLGRVRNKAVLHSQPLRPNT